MPMPMPMPIRKIKVKGQKRLSRFIKLLKLDCKFNSTFTSEKYQGYKTFENGKVTFNFTTIK